MDVSSRRSDRQRRATTRWSDSSRGCRTVSQSKYGLSANRAIEYGRDVAVLTGDIQHGWSITLFVKSALQSGVDPTLILKIIAHLQSYVLGNLIFGEVLDVRYGIQDIAALEVIDEAKIVKMLWLKTGVLYEFAGMAGALIGKNTCDFDDPEVRAIASFASACGTAFQLQDDILGIAGDERPWANRWGRTSERERRPSSSTNR